MAYGAARRAGSPTTTCATLLDEPPARGARRRRGRGVGGPRRPRPAVPAGRRPRHWSTRPRSRSGAGQVNAVLVGAKGTSHDDARRGDGGGVRRRRGATAWRVGFEFARASALRSLADALAVRALLPHHDVGVTVDTWQLHWGPSTIADLAAAPGDGDPLRAGRRRAGGAARRPAPRHLRGAARARRRGRRPRRAWSGRSTPSGTAGPLTVEVINAELIARARPGDARPSARRRDPCGGRGAPGARLAT